MLLESQANEHETLCSFASRRTKWFSMKMFLCWLRLTSKGKSTPCQYQYYPCRSWGNKYYYV